MITECTLLTDLRKYCSDNGVTIFHTKQEEYWSYKNKVCYVNPDISEVDTLLLEVKALRAAYLDIKGAKINPLQYSPDDAILINRIYKADQAAFLCRVAWECKLNGSNGLWNRIKDSSLKNIAQAFTKEAQSNWRSLRSGEAMTFALETYFLSDIFSCIDRILIKQMLADYGGYIFDDSLKEKNIPSVAELLTKIGQVNDNSKNYLVKYVNTIMSDPIFTDIRDRSNANFLWFIKFERSFREKEEELKPICENILKKEYAGESNNIVQFRKK